MGWEGGDGISVLTVGNTLVLDLQVLVSPWAGVWEHVGPRYHHTLGAVITPARGDSHKKREEEEVSDCSLIARKTKKMLHTKKTSSGSERWKER